MAVNGIFGKCGDKLAQTSEGRTFRWGLRQDTSQAFFVSACRRTRVSGCRREDVPVTNGTLWGKISSYQLLTVPGDCTVQISPFLKSLRISAEEL